MASGAAGDGLLRRMFEGCISSVDTGIQRRPYHKNCKCALHKSRGHCKHASPPCSNVSYPIKRSWSEGCLVLMMNPSTPEVTSPSRSSSSSSPRVTAAATMGDISRTQTQLVLCIEEEDEEVEQSVSFSYKV